MLSIALYNLNLHDFRAKMKAYMMLALLTSFTSNVSLLILISLFICKFYESIRQESKGERMNHSPIKKYFNPLGSGYFMNVKKFIKPQLFSGKRRQTRHCFTTFCFILFCFNALCQFRELNLHSLIFLLNVLWLATHLGLKARPRCISY